MITFRPLELEDKATIQKYTLHSTRRNCDLSFANLYSWRFLYRTQIAELHGFLLFRFYLEERPVYMMPVGEGDISTILPLLLEDARQYPYPFRMFGVCTHMKEELENKFPGQFTFTADRDYADYLYLRSDLATLKGKKYQAKRNHINKFRNLYPNHEYKALTPDLIKECMRLETQWCKANNCAENEALEAERRAMTTALKYMEELDIQGGVLYVNQEIVAFTFGSLINHQTFDTCVEKANTAIEGAYTVINYEFANQLPEQYIYINREEDLGIEGLRKAKLSYHPDTLLEKYIVELK